MTHTQHRGIAFVGLVIALVCFSPHLMSQQPSPLVVEVPGAIPTPTTDDRPSQPAVPTKEVPSPAAPSNMPESVGWALGAAYIIEYLKKTRWFTFLTEESSSKAKAIFAFIAAFLTAAGIQYTVSGSVLDAGGASVSFTGITLIGIKDVLFQWIAQQGWYDFLVKKYSAATFIRAAH